MPRLGPCGGVIHHFLGEFGFAPRADASFLACSSAAARLSVTAAASTAGSRAAGSDMLPPAPGLPPLVPPLVPAEPEHAEAELAVAVDPRVGGTVGRLLVVARAEAESGAGPRRGAAALPGAARPAALPRVGSSLALLPRAGSR